MDRGAHRSALGQPHGPDLCPGRLGRLGLAPAGFDAATLYLHSLAVPDMPEQVHREFADQLAARDGLLAQLYVTGRMLLRINSGDYPDLAIPLHHNAERVLAALQH